jgi:hypothetical protein
MPAPSINNNAGAEWFEVLAHSEVDLNEVELVNESTGSTHLTSESCLTVPAGERVIFARSDDPTQNGGLDAVTGVFDFTLADAASSTRPERSIALRHNGLELTRASWAKCTKGASWQLQEAELSLDAGTVGPEAEIGFDSWCVTPTGITFGLGDRGTPGQHNVSCE